MVVKSRLYCRLISFSDQGFLIQPGGMVICLFIQSRYKSTDSWIISGWKRQGHMKQEVKNVGKEYKRLRIMNRTVTIRSE